jgi:hypothetical protein
MVRQSGQQNDNLNRSITTEGLNMPRFSAFQLLHPA